MPSIVVFILGIVGGGAERFAVTLSGGLAEYGYDVSLLTGPKQDGEYEVSGAVNRVILLDERSWHGSSNILKWVSVLHSYLDSNRPDILISVGIAPNLISCMVAGHVNTKIVVCERNAPKQDTISRKSKFARFLLYRRADAFVFQTPGAQAFYSKKIQRRSVVIPNPVLPGLPAWSPRGRKEIVAVGRLMPQKNYPLMLKAFSLAHESLPDWKLRIFGEGTHLQEYKELSALLGIADSVVFEGFCKDVHEQIAGSDIFLMTSDYEGMPNALLEAMAMGMPCISTDCPAGGPAMLIDDGMNGLLCPVGDAEAIAGAIVRLVNDVALRMRLARAASTARDQYSIEKVLALWKQLISGLCCLQMDGSR